MLLISAADIYCAGLDQPQITIWSGVHTCMTTRKPDLPEDLALSSSSRILAQNQRAVSWSVFVG